MENNNEKLKQLNIDTDAHKAFKPQFLQAVKRFGKVALVSSMLALNMACQQPTGPEPEPIPTPIEQPENPETTPENPENTPTNPGNNPENPGNNPENPGNNPTNPENPNGGNEEQTDQAVQNVISLIDALPNANEITDENKATVQAQIDAIEAAYAGLTAEQKQQVTNYSKVTAAKNKIAELENALNQQQNQFPEPTTATLGDYTMYDFVQNNIIQYGGPLAEMELNYLQKAEGYIQNNLNALSDSAKQNTTIRNAINYYNQNAKKHYQEGTYTDIGAAHNETSKAIAPVFQDIAKAKQYDSQRKALKLCYEIIANEGYKYGLGVYSTTSGINSNYTTKKAELIDAVKGTTYFTNRNIDIEQIYSSNNFTPITTILTDLLTTEGITTADSQKFINIALVTESERALAEREKAAGLNMTQLKTGTIVSAIEQYNEQLYNVQQSNEMGM